MGDRDDSLLDLSTWPAPPRTGSLPSRGSLPPRPSRPTRAVAMPRVPVPTTAVGLVLAVLGLAMLLVPTGGCGPALRAWTSSPAAVPVVTTPRLDDQEVARDAQAVARAEAALSAFAPPSPAPTPTPTPTRGPQATSPRPRSVTVSVADPSAVAAAQHDVAVAQHAADAAQAELDRILAQQEASADPGAYDGQVAAAREELERTVAARDDARRTLAMISSRTRTVTVTASPAPRTASPAPRPTGSAGSADRASLEAALADATAQQAAHLAARRRALTEARSSGDRAALRLQAHNVHLRACHARAGVPAGGGLASLLVGTVVLTGPPLLRLARR